MKLYLQSYVCPDRMQQCRHIVLFHHERLNQERFPEVAALNDSEPIVRAHISVMTFVGSWEIYDEDKLRRGDLLFRQLK